MSLRKKSVSKIQFDEVPEGAKKFVIFDVNGEAIGWSMNETDYQAVEDWNKNNDWCDNWGWGTSAVEVGK